MKNRLLSTLFLLPLVIFSFSCTKTGTDNEPKLDDRLVNTKWQCEDNASELLFGGTCYEVYEFISTTEVDRYTTRNGVVRSSDGTFKYTLEYPKITIYAKTSKGEDDTEYFTFTDNRTMVRDGTDGKGFYAKYMRQ